MTKSDSLRNLLIFLLVAVTTFSVGKTHDNIHLMVPASPTITNFSPLSGPVGTSVIITGTNFNTITTSNIVFFGATRATVTAASEISLTVTVPVGATYKPISVLNSSTFLTGYSDRPFVTTFSPNNSLVTEANFFNQLNFSLTGSSVPECMAIGDLDGDGKADLATANSDPTAVSVSIFRNTSTGGAITASSFAGRVDLPLSAGTPPVAPTAIVINDLNADGKPELIVVTTASVSVYTNTSTSGNLSFVKTELPIINGIGLSVGDLDSDGKPDIIVSARKDKKVMVLRNTSTAGNLSFAAATAIITIAANGPEHTAVGDFDGDGKPDLSFVNRAGGVLSVYRNISTPGNIVFDSAISLGTGDKPEASAIGDFNGDGKPDIAFTDSKTNFVSVFQNTSSSGTISFAARVNFNADQKVRGIGIADIDGDGKIDIITAATNGGGVLSVFRNTHTSGAISTSSFGERSHINNYIQDVTIGDIDGDGRPDIAGTNLNLVSVVRFNPFKTKISEDYCGTTLLNIDSAIRADLVPSATTYRFRVTQGGNVQTFDSQTNSFQLTQLTTFAYNTAYTIDVQILAGGVWGDYETACVVNSPVASTKVSSTFCGTTLTDIDTAIPVDNVPLAVAYRFRVTQNGEVQTLDGLTNSFKLSQLTNHPLGVSYSIEAQVQIGTTWSAFGAACVVNSPIPTSQLSSSFRGKILATMDSPVTADVVPLATGYRFRVSKNAEVQTVDVLTSSFNFTQLSSYAYNTTYSIDVQVQIGEIWSVYGSAYELTTPVRTTQISVLFRDKTLANIDSAIYADPVSSATGYRFRAKHEGIEQIIDTVTNSFKLTRLSSYAYNTAYSIDVAVQTNETWGAYGTAYEVTSPSPTTQVSESFRGITLANIDSAITADPVPLARSYRFRVTNEGNEQTVDAETNSFKITQLDDFAYDTEYGLDVAVEVGGTMGAFGMSSFVMTPVPITKIGDAYCGKTLPEIDGTIIYIDNVPLATAYRIRLTLNGVEKIIETPFNNFRLTHFGKVDYGTTYSIDIQVQVGEEWSEYGTACLVTTGIAPPVKINDTQCGTTLTSMDAVIYANRFPSSTSYRYRLSLNGNEQIIVSPLNSFRLTQFTNLNYNTTYNLDVQIETNGIWSAYGPVCTITTPAVSLTKVSATYSGTVLTSLEGNISADNIYFATAYRFKITNGGREEILESDNTNLLLSRLSFYGYNSTYSVEVAAKASGIWGAYGAACTITTAPLLTRISNSFCGSTLPELDGTVIFIDRVPLATVYRIRLTLNGTQQIIETPLNNFRMTHFASYEYNKTYSVDVQVQVGGTWSAYGPACAITTPIVPAIKISDTFCGKTLTDINDAISTNSFPLATSFRFRLTLNGNEQTSISNVNSFRPTHFANIAYSTTYSVDAQVMMDGTWSAYGPACTITTPSEPLPKISASFCGNTLADIGGSVIYIDNAPLATNYRIRLSLNGVQQVIETPANNFRITHFANIAYNTTYSLDVQVQVKGIWSAYGPVCAITTPTVPAIKISDTFCGKTLTDINDAISTNSFPLATSFRFRLTLNGNEQTSISNVNSFRPTHFANIAYSTTYSVDAQVMMDGTWSAYGPACTITTPSEPLPKISASFCGNTLADIGGSVIYIDNAPLATNYRIRVSLNGVQQVIETPANNFRITHFANIAYNTTYSLDVQVQVKGIWTAYGPACTVTTPAIPVTQLSTSYCGKMLTTMDGLIYADNVYLATAYRFKITQNSKEEILESNTNLLALSKLSFYTYNSSYTVQVSANVGGTWTSYGAACTVTIPVLTPKIADSFCGKTIPELDGTIISIDNISLATMYRIRRTLNGKQEIIETKFNNFRMTHFPTYAYNTSYSLEVQVQIGGIWTAYGPACSVSTPSIPLTQLAASFCGKLLSSAEGTIQSNITTLATAYRFKVSQDGREEVLESATRDIALNKLSFYAFNTTYNIQVAAKVGGTWTDYGAVCTVTTITPLTTAALSALDISAGTLSTVFNPATLTYTVSLSYATTTFRVRPSTTDGSTIKVNGSALASGKGSETYAMNVGNNTLVVELTSQNGASTKTYTFEVIRLDADEIFPDKSGNVLVTNKITQVVVVSPTQSISVTVPAEITKFPTIDYGNLITGGTGIIPQTTVNSTLTKLSIPAATEVTASNAGWDGVLLTPALTTYNLPQIPGQVITPGLIIEVGSADYSLSFSKAVRLTLTGQAGMRIARVHDNVYKEVLLTGEDNQGAADLLPADGTFKVDVGPDLVIWTKVFSKYITFNQTTDLDVVLVQNDKAELTSDLIKASNTDISSVAAPLLLPATGTFGSEITWVSDNPSVVSADGQIFRPAHGTGNVAVTITATIKKGLISETKSFVVIVTEIPNQAPTLNAISNQTVCPVITLQAIQLSGITSGPENGQTTSLSVTSDKPAMFSELNVVNDVLTYRLNINASGEAIITVTVKDNGGTTNGGNDTFSQIFKVTINPLSVNVISSDRGDEISKGLTAILTVPAISGATYSWANAAGIISGQNSPVLTVRPAVTTTYILNIINTSGCSSIQSFTLNVRNDYTTLDMRNILTPNGDGKNDFLVIENLDMYPNNIIKIFNRTGQQVYQQANYKNDWTGTFNGSPLPNDTYYYILGFGTGIGTFKGYVSIIR
jgi:gliding motility-associated-like protein